MHAYELPCAMFFGFKYVFRCAGLEVLKRIPLASADHAKHLQLLSWFVNKVQLMQPGHMLILPGGWVVRPLKVLRSWPSRFRPPVRKA
jgi:hypothetical protein